MKQPPCCIGCLAATAQKTFEQGVLSHDLPTIPGSPGDGLLSLFVAAGLGASNGEVRRAVANNSVSVNDTKITDPGYVVSEADFDADGFMKISLGKKRHALVKRR